MKEILESHPVSTLRKEVSKVNKEIKGKNPFLGAYKLPKPQLISLMLKHKDKFKHIKMKKKEKVKRVDRSILKDIEKKDISEKVKKTKKEKPKEIPISFKEYQEMKQKSKVLNFLTDVEYARSNIPLQVKRTKDVKPKVSKKLSKKEIKIIVEDGYISLVLNENPKEYRAETIDGFPVILNTTLQGKEGKKIKKYGSTYAYGKSGRFSSNEILKIKKRLQSTEGKKYLEFLKKYDVYVYITNEVNKGFNDKGEEDRKRFSLQDITRLSDEMIKKIFKK